jgi:hypothetical protein
MHCLKKSKSDKWVKKMNLICIPFAYEENMNSGVNVSIKGKGKIEIYLKNACVALISAKYYNPDSDVALVTNFGR